MTNEGLGFYVKEEVIACHLLRADVYSNHRTDCRVCVSIL